MDSTLKFLTNQITILQSDENPQDAEFFCYRFGQNDQTTKSYAVSQLAQSKAILISHRTGICGHGYGIAYIDDDTPSLLHDIALEDFIGVLSDKKFTDEKLAVIIKNCTAEHRTRILSYLENQKLDASIENNKGTDHLVF